MKSINKRQPETDNSSKPANPSGFHLLDSEMDYDNPHVFNESIGHAINDLYNTAYKMGYIEGGLRDYLDKINNTPIPDNKTLLIRLAYLQTAMREKAQFQQVVAS